MSASEKSSAPPRHAPGSALRFAARAAFRTLTTLALPGALLSTAAWFWSEPALLAQLSPFRVQYAVLLSAHALFCLLLRRRRWALVFALFALFNAGVVFHAIRLHRAAMPPSPARSATPAPPLKILVSNVLTSNRDPAPLLALIAREKPDLIGLLEVDQRWQTQLLPALAAEYGFHRIRAREDNFGLALFAREQPLDEKTEYLAGIDLPSLAVTYPYAGGAIRLLLTHPVPPGDNATNTLRNRHLEEVALWSRAAAALAAPGASPFPVLILGDLNSTPWCPPLRHLLASAGLHSAAADRGRLAASWPVDVPFLRIPLDHALLGPELVCLSHRLGPDIGSDHFPVLVEIGRRP